MKKRDASRGSLRSFGGQKAPPQDDHLALSSRLGAIPDKRITQFPDYRITQLLWLGCLPVYGIDAPVDNLSYLP